MHLERLQKSKCFFCNFTKFQGVYEKHFIGYSKNCLFVPYD